MQLTGQAENRFYGHVHILAQYCGLTGSPWINGYLQHGWNATDGFGNFLGSKRKANKFVWSKRCQEIIKKSQNNVVAIGAPWIYLDDVFPRESKKPIKGVVAYPAHSSTWSKLGDTSNEYAKYLKEKYEKVTIVLHRYDFANIQIKNTFEKFGHEVTTHGIGTPWEFGFDPFFLKNQRDLLLNYSKVVSNVMSTPILYGLSLGLSAEIGGPVDYSITNINDKASQTGDGTTNWSLMISRDQTLWSKELGKDCKKDPFELREVLGWSDKPKKSISYFFSRTTDLFTGSNLFVSAQVFKSNLKNNR